MILSMRQNENTISISMLSRIVCLYVCASTYISVYLIYYQLKDASKPPHAKVMSAIPFLSTYSPPFKNSSICMNSLSFMVNGI